MSRKQGAEGGRRRGGKGAAVKEEGKQLVLAFATAEELPRGGDQGRRRRDRSRRKTPSVPKVEVKARHACPASLERVIGRLEEAFEKVAANRGAPGPDRQTIGEVRKQLPELLGRLRVELRRGRYQPGAIRRVWIPKGGGKQRGLGIPNVIDRVVQEAIRAELEPLYEPTFHGSSHGFRPKRSCQTAIQEAKGYVEEGYEWVVDMDLSKFFDRVHHQRLMARLAERVNDRGLLVLIGRYLKANVVMPSGVKVMVEEGVPQGGPLSPLLANIVLSELDEELARRGHRFVRYADDVNVYVRSERAGKRVMESLRRFITSRLRLEVNEDKSAVARPETRHFLGYRLIPMGKGEAAQIGLSERSRKRLREKVVELTPRNAGRSLGSTITRVNAYFRGWLGHFGVCSKSAVDRVLRGVDAHLRRRLRAIVLKHWKRKRTIAKRLIALGVSVKTAWRRVYEGRKSLWALSADAAVHRGLRNTYFVERGLISLQQAFCVAQAVQLAPVQLLLDWDTARSKPDRRQGSQPVVPRSRM